MTDPSIIDVVVDTFDGFALFLVGLAAVWVAAFAFMLWWVE